jgi:hypothetical protein
MSFTTEELFLKIFKFVILALMGLALVASVIALVAGLWFMATTAQEPAPAQAAPEKEVNIEDFIKQLEGDKGAPKEEEKKQSETPPEKPAPVKYLEEARKIIGCLTESSSKAKIDANPFSDAAIEEFRRDLQRVADSPSASRGQPYVTDAVRVVCAILLHEKVIALRAKNKELRVFIPAINFHMRAWDAIQDEARNFEAAEERRVAGQRRAEELRVEAARSTGKSILLGAAIAFGLFMAIALYLIIAAMESHMRRISDLLARREATLETPM